MLTDRNKIIQKWRPILESVFNDIKYLLPFIEDEVSYQIELMQYKEADDAYTTTHWNPSWGSSNLSVTAANTKLPLFVKNIHTYLTENIPTTYLDDMKTCVNPMTGEILYKYNGKFFGIKELQKQRIEDFLIDIDFNNVIDKLYDNDPKIYIRKLKLKKLSGKSDGNGL